MSETIIETQDLTVYYGKHRGIEGVNLTVNQGEIFGFLGPNGAGKTTTQRVLLDIFPPTSGEARIFGLDCQQQGVEIRKRVGYLPGEMALYPDMVVREFFDMMAFLRGKKATEYPWKPLAERLELDATRKIGELSRGNKQKVGVVTAFMSHPDLLILDEPTTGLDPIAQHTVLEMVREVQKAGRTVFFSSHILSEVQSVCDRVGILRGGKLITTQAVEALFAQRLNRIQLIFHQLPPEGTFTFEGVTEMHRQANKIQLEVRENLSQVLATAAQFEVVDIETQNINLEDIFLAYYGNGNGEKHV